ncbi:MAG: hypothetical protein NZ570_03145, partial [Candidatus Caldarchaeum sp.]|nr:hypothetical protein [Candidatus Caldarchaeum sp.]
RKTLNKTLEILRELGVDVFEKGGEAAAPKPGIPASCPACGGKTILFQEGCQTCLDCGWSSCVVA